VTSQVMTKLTVVLLAAIFCIILADVSGEQSTETDILPEKLSDKNLVKREADPAKRRRRKLERKNARGVKVVRNAEEKKNEGVVKREEVKVREERREGNDVPRRGELKERKSVQRVKREKIVEMQKSNQGK